MWRKILLVVLGLAVGLYFLDDFEPDTLKGKNVLITGASTGIGEQVAHYFSKFGANVFITSRREHVLKQVTKKCRELGRPDGKYLYMAADMSNLSSTEDVIREAEASLGGIDILVLNHILGIKMADWEGSSENFTLLDKIIDVNFKAYVHLASYALPHLQKSHGSIVVVSSIVGKIGSPALAIYAATKFALYGFFNSLRQEFKLKNCDISITLCTIGMIGTESTVRIMKDYGLQYLLTLIPPAQPEAAGLAIVKGAATGAREIFYPYFQTKAMLLFRDWIPDILDAFFRMLHSNRETV